jgi:hypothetical protein
VSEVDISEIFQGYAEAFIGRVRGEGDIDTPGALRREELDYSFGSLAHVDAYLDTLHRKHGPRRGFLGIGARDGVLVTPSLENSILWGGAYVGEVIRRSRDDCDWVDYDDYIPEHPKLRDALGPRGLTTCAFMVQRAPQGGYGDMTMPVNKVLRYIREGDEHATRSYAQTALGGASKAEP